MKESYYFSHDYNPTSDPKIQALIGEHGAVGYGLYWRIVEMLHEEATHKLPCKKYIYLALAKQMSLDVEIVELVVNYCIELCELFNTDGIMFWSERVLRNIGKRNEISTKRSEAGKRSAELRKSSASVEQNPTNVEQVSTSVEQNPTKERKVKENKENKNKDSNIDIQQAEHLDENYIKFNSWLKDNATNVLKIKNQITQAEFLKLKEKYSSQQIMNVIESLDNYAPASKKYVSVYKTVLKWLDKPTTGKNSYEKVEGLSKHEEMYEGKRTYVRYGVRHVIPDNAPPRPSEYDNYSAHNNSWIYVNQ